MGVELKPTMWAELRADCYSGPNSDRVKPRWHGYADGDKDAEDIDGVLNLSPRSFPPGTKIVISEPCCPKCGDQRSPVFPTPKRGPLYRGPCACGFDWDTWVLDQFS